MFHVADRLTEEATGEQAVPSSPRLALVAGPALVQAGSQPARYGGQGRVNVPAIILIILVHMAVIAALIQVRHHVVRLQEAHLSVVNLTPPPPPPAAETTPPPPQPKIVAPPPLVQVPVPVPTVATISDPVPVPLAPALVAAPVPAAMPSVMTAPSGIVQGGDIGTQMVAGKPPRYPIDSRRKREQGVVVLTLTLSIDGAVESLAVTQSSGFARLDNAARDAVRGWRWKPMIRDGQAVRVRGVVEIPFVLRGE